MIIRNIALAAVVGIASLRAFAPEICPVFRCEVDDQKQRVDDTREPGVVQLKPFDTVTSTVATSAFQVVVQLEPTFLYPPDPPAWPPPSRDIRHAQRVALDAVARVAMSAAIEERLRFIPRRLGGPWMVGAPIV